MTIQDIIALQIQEIQREFQSVLDWIKAIWPIKDNTALEEITQRKNYLIIGIYAANEYLVESLITNFFQSLYWLIEAESGHSLTIRNERVKIASITKNNHNWTRQGLEGMLSDILGNVDTKKIIKDSWEQMGSEFSVFFNELTKFKDLRDKITHSSKNCFTDIAWSSFDVIEINKSIARIEKLRKLFTEFSECFYQELNKIYKIPNR